MTGSNYCRWLNMLTITCQPTHTRWPYSSLTTSFTHRQNGWKREKLITPWATMHVHWMQDIHQQTKQTLENTWESMNKDYDRKAMEPPTIVVSDLVMLNTKNICTKGPLKQLCPKLYAPFKVLEKKRSWAYKFKISPQWKIYRVFHVSLLEHYQSSNRPNREQLPRDPDVIASHLEWEVERMVKGEIISYIWKVRGRNKPMHKLRYFVKSRGLREGWQYLGTTRRYEQQAGRGGKVS